jgi:hypothetical protein
MAANLGEAGPSARAPRHTDRESKQDEKRGRADARKGLPLVLRQRAPGPAGVPGAPAEPATGASTPTGPTAPAVEVTPFLKRLFGEREQALAELLAEHRSKEAPLLEDLHAATEEHKHLLEKCETINARLANLSKPLAEEDATRRLGGEEKAGHSEEFVRGRRVGEWQREISAVQAQLDALSDQAHRASIAAGRANDRLDALRKVTHAQGLAINSYYEQRKGSYLTGLAHQHRRGPELVRALMLIDPGLPDWLSWNNDALEGA